ncbi:NADP-dependent alcohol dehydrogenase 7 [[Candida] anglica]|uniref:NADP-dependent alcohol dehydrogenase 7 n=1 Tax=[Candida] anglica TaxID=148631 RepID=A0ABP0EGX8_9ASCO
MSTTVPEYFQGFGVDKAENWNKPKLVSYKGKAVGDNDVVLKNIACGLCGSDILTASGQWSPLLRDDLVVGHEIIGHVIAVGKNVTQVKIGQRCGIGAHSSSCMSDSCGRCSTDNEQYCKINGVGTYNAVDATDKYVTQGGYSSHSVAHEQFVFPIPDELETSHAAPLMCAGLTVFSPLVRNIGRDAKGKTVGIIGIGGLGHLAIQFAHALGANVIAFSRSSSKKDQAVTMGASTFIATGEEKDWTTTYDDKFDFILNCASGTDLDLDSYLSVLKVDAKFVSAGLPPSADKYSVSPFSFVKNAGNFGSSLLGSKVEALEMLKIAAEHGVKPWVEEIPISEANCNTALTRCNDGDVRYRFVFTEFDKAFK